MFFLSRPDDHVISNFLAVQGAATFSYPRVGDSRLQSAPHGYVVDHNRIQLGTGEQAFERAKAALRQWKMFALPWMQLCWPSTPVETGTNVAILVRHFGFWSLNAARIVYVIDEGGPCAEYGFAYGTLQDHGERGEERFAVEFHHRSGEVWYDLFAFSRPNLAARLGYPLSRALQKRFARESLAAMRRAVAAPAD